MERMMDGGGYGSDPMTSETGMPPMGEARPARKRGGAGGKKPARKKASKARAKGKARGKARGKTGARAKKASGKARRR
jgi:hypothetical protein